MGGNTIKFQIDEAVGLDYTKDEIKPKKPLTRKEITLVTH